MTRKRGTSRTAVTLGSLTVMTLTGGFATGIEETGTAHPHFLTPEAKRDIAEVALTQGISVGALIEIEASAGQEDGESFSDVAVATVELAVEANVNDWISANALLLWEEDETEPVDLDEAAITLGGTEDIPYSLKVGRIYLPFGHFTSHFVSDPITLELGETRESAVLLGYKSEMLDFRIGAFNGELDNEDADSHVDNIVASVSVSPYGSFELGASWISDIGESDGLREGLAATAQGADDTSLAESGDSLTVEAGGPGLTHANVAGVAGFATLQIGPFALDGEYIAAADRFEADRLTDATVRPTAWNAELAFCFQEDRAAEVAFKWEGSNEFPGFPERQYGIAFSMNLTEGTTLGAEILHGEFADETEDRNVVTVQLAVEM